MTNTPPPFDPNTNPKAAAKAAKAYAKASRPWFKKKRFIIPIAVVALAVFMNLGGESEPADDTASTSEESAVKTKPAAKKDAEKKKAPAQKKVKPVKVDAKTLIEEFEKNELAGDKKYKGKTLQVSGVVSKIDTELWDDDKYILQINGGGDFEFLTVDCADMSNDDLSTLDTGEDVTVIGEFDDGGDLGVDLKKCKLK